MNINACKLSLVGPRLSQVNISMAYLREHEREIGDNYSHIQDLQKGTRDG